MILLAGPVPAIVALPLARFFAARSGKTSLGSVIPLYVRRGKMKRQPMEDDVENNRFCEV